MQKYIYKIFSLNKGEFWLLLYSTLFIRSSNTPYRGAKKRTRA
ncbi:hypothetical protein [Campylobacter sp. 7477a]